MVFLTTELKAEAHSSLFLSANVRHTISTNIKESQLSATLSLWLLSSQSNSRYPMESQKIEVEGLDQVELESHIKKIVSADRSVHYSILIKQLKETMKAKKSIFLKISAN